MQKLKGVDLEKFYADLSEGMKPVTVRSIHQIVRTALAYAVRHEIIKRMLLMSSALLLLVPMHER